MLNVHSRLQYKKLTRGSSAETGCGRTDERLLDSGHSTAAPLRSYTRRRSPHSPSLRCPAQAPLCLSEQQGWRSEAASEQDRRGTPLPGRSEAVVGHQLSVQVQILRQARTPQSPESPEADRTRRQSQSLPEIRDRSRAGCLTLFQHRRILRRHPALGHPLILLLHLILILLLYLHLF